MAGTRGAHLQAGVHSQTNSPLPNSRLRLLLHCVHVVGKLGRQGGQLKAAGEQHNPPRAGTESVDCSVPSVCISAGT